MQLKRHGSSYNNEFLNNWPIFIKYGIRVTTRNLHFFLFLAVEINKQGTSQLQRSGMLYDNTVLKACKFYIENNFYKAK